MKAIFWGVHAGVAARLLPILLNYYSMLYNGIGVPGISGSGLGLLSFGCGGTLLEFTMADAAVLKLFADLGDVLVKVVQVKKDYDSAGIFAIIGEAVALLKEGDVILADIKAAIPEFTSLTPAEDKEVMAALLACFQKVVGAI